MAIHDAPITNMVPVADTATDADSTNTALLADKMRIYCEMLLEALFCRFNSGTLTSDPPNDTTGYAYDTAAGFTTDQHNDQRIIFTSGLALGQDFLIDDTVASSRVVCTGDNLYAAGARSGDSYIIVGNFRNSTGHIHDGKNGRNFVPYLSSVASMTGVEFSTVSTSYVTAFVIRIYVPQNATSLKLSVRYKISAPGYNAYQNFIIGALTSSANSDNATSYTWTSAPTMDITSLSPGYYTVVIQTKSSSGSGTAYIDAFNLLIE